jgi:hypothetical protein
MHTSQEVETPKVSRIKKAIQSYRDFEKNLNFGGFFMNALKSVCLSIDTPRSLAVYLLFLNNEAAQILDFQVNPNDYTANSIRRLCILSGSKILLNASRSDTLDHNLIDWALEKDVLAFKYDYLITEMFSKSDFLADFNKSSDAPLDSAKTAMQGFIKSETACFESSIRLFSYSNSSSCEENVEMHLASMRKILLEVLEPVNGIDFSTLYGWGPGVTCTLGSGENETLSKLTEFPIQIYKSQLEFHKKMISNDKSLLYYLKSKSGERVTHPFPTAKVCADLISATTDAETNMDNALDLSVSDACDLSPLDSYYSFSDGAEFQLVPKSAKTDRCISIEPTGAVACQMAIGRYMRSRLKLCVGVDLTDQGRNQNLARLAFDNDLATIDLSSASDSITVALLALLFPPDWVDLLVSHRSTHYKVGSARYEQWKFGGMGNAIVFPLESLIFYVCARVCSDRISSELPVAIYGDDIIVHQKVVPDLVGLLAFLGFRLNEKKTHTGKDCFYESCGEHYFHGKLVTPIYQKLRPDSTEEIVRFHNRIYRYGACKSYDNSDTYLYQEFHGTICAIRRYLPKSGRDLDQPVDDHSDSGLLCIFASPKGAFKLDPATLKRAVSDEKAYQYSLWMMGKRLTIDSNVYRKRVVIKLGFQWMPFLIRQFSALHQEMSQYEIDSSANDSKTIVFQSIVDWYTNSLGCSPEFMDVMSPQRLLDENGNAITLSYYAHRQTKIAVAYKSVTYDFKYRT